MVQLVGGALFGGLGQSPKDGVGRSTGSGRHLDWQACSDNRARAVGRTVQEKAGAVVQGQANSRGLDAVEEVLTA